MNIDLRYIIPIAAFFAPALAMKAMVWFWGASIEGDAGIVVFASFGFGTIATWVAAFILFVHHEPLIFRIGRKSGK